MDIKNSKFDSIKFNDFSEYWKSDMDATLNNTKASMKNLLEFLDNYKCDEEPNIWCPRNGKYNIPEVHMDTFFKLLEKCRKSKVFTHFFEKQQDPSGIMLDFDIEQDNEESQIRDYHIEDLIREVLKLLLSHLETETIDTWICVIQKPAPVKKIKDDKIYYKDGFHILIPGVKVSKKYKNYLVKYIRESDILEDIFDEVSFHGKLKDILDMGSASVPVNFIGSCAMHKKVAYPVKYIIKTKACKREGKNHKITLTKPSLDEINIPYEFSLNYEKKNGMVKKNIYSPNSIIEARLVEYAPIVTEKVSDSLSILQQYDADAAEIIQLVKILSSKRRDLQPLWWRVIVSLAYLGPQYYDLAKEFSNRPGKGIREEFDIEWTKAVNTKGKYGFSRRTIHNYAREDNYEKYKLITSNSVGAKLHENIKDPTLGKLGSWHYAKLLHIMVGTRFNTDYSPIDKKKMWYEFIIDPNRCAKGEIYKYRSREESTSLMNYMSEIMPNIFDREYKMLNNSKEKRTEETEIKYYSKLIANLIKSKQSLYDHNSKLTIMKECANVFMIENFTRELDQEPMILGVGNGVVRLTCPPLLIQGYHEYKISRYTTTDYKELNRNCEITLDLFKSIWELFPEGEKDMFWFMMFFFGTSTDGNIKARMFLMLTGGGANGKSYFVELVRRALGDATEMGYGYKMSLKYLTSQDADAGRATPELQPLAHARIVYFSEANKNETANVSKIKKLTSGEVINARGLFKGQNNFTVRANFLLQTNFALRIETRDHGSWRRVKKYKMKIKFCPNPNPENKYERKEDRSYADTKVSDPRYLSSMLSLLVMARTILQVKYNGDITAFPCYNLDKESEEFRNEQDNINRFITEKIVILDEKTLIETPINNLIDKYLNWYGTNITNERKIHDMTSLRTDFENSRLGKYINKRENSVFLSGIRILDTGERKGVNEKNFINGKKDYETTNSKECKNYIEALNHFFDMYENAIKQ